MNALVTPGTVRVVARYAIHEELAAGGMASVHLGRLLGEVGFARTVAIKMLHSQYARDPEFVAMFLDEARLVSRIKHPNVVPTLDIVSLDGELFLVMEYVHGEPLHRVMAALGRRKERMPVNIAVGICLGLLEGLHAAHEAKSEDGEAMGIVHRDVSPQNVMVGADGITRVLDFGIAKAAKRIQTTEDGQFKGKLGYMPPDVLTGGKVDRRADVWGVSVVLWEMLVGKRLFVSDESPFALVQRIVESEVDAPSKRKVASPPELDAVVARGLSKDPDKRYATAREMAIALEKAVPPASTRAISEWLHAVAEEALSKRAARVEAVEVASRPERLTTSAVHSLASTAPASRPALSSTVDAHESTLVLPPPQQQFATMPTPPPSSYSSYAQPTKPKSRIVQSILAAVVFVVVIVPVGIFALEKIMPKAPHKATPVATADSSAAPALALVSASASAFVSPAESAPLPDPPPTTTTTTTSSTPAPAPSHKHSQTTTTTATPPSPKCNPPYTIGPAPDYIRKPKIECLNH